MTLVSMGSFWGDGNAEARRERGTEMSWRERDMVGEWGREKQGKIRGGERWGWGESGGGKGRGVGER